jgi:amino-acid N-acetyltransferase
MNTQLMADAPRAPRRRTTRPHVATRIGLRTASAADVPAIATLIAAHLEEGRLLPRSVSDLTAHADRFVVAERRGRIVGCAELAPLSGRVAEVRSLVVDHRARGLGVGRRLVAELQRRAAVAGYEQLCAFGHDAAFFVRLGFSIVPHTWVPEKIARDCVGCALFRRCGQHALVVGLDTPESARVETFVPLSSLRS